MTVRELRAKLFEIEDQETDVLVWEYDSENEALKLSETGNVQIDLEGNVIVS